MSLTTISACWRVSAKNWLLLRQWLPFMVSVCMRSWKARQPYNAMSPCQHAAAGATTRLVPNAQAHAQRFAGQQ